MNSYSQVNYSGSDDWVSDYGDLLAVADFTRYKAAYLFSVTHPEYSWSRKTAEREDRE